MKGVFENDKFYNIQKKDDSSSHFTWRGGCTAACCDYWELDRYLPDFQVEDADAETITYVAKNGEKKDCYTYETIEVEESAEEYTMFTLSANIPHGPSEYFEMFDDCVEVHAIKVPCGKRLVVKGVLKVDLRTNEYEVPEEYTVEEVQS